MRRLPLLLLPLLLIVAGCGGTSKPSPPRVTQPATLQATPLESARTPEGAKPQAPPVSLPPSTVSEKHIDTAGLRLIEGFENVYKATYCPEYDEYGGVWDIGFGQTEGIGPDSPCITHAQAEANLRYLVEARYEWAIRALGVPFNQHEWDALCSFVWNVGAGDVLPSSPVGSLLSRRLYRQATDLMLQYDHAGGVILAGLRIRREREVALFWTPEPKPSPTPAQKKAQLDKDYTLRNELRHLLVTRGCRARVKRHEQLGPKCSAWFRQGNAVNAQITQLHHEGVF